MIVAGFGYRAEAVALSLTDAYSRAGGGAQKLAFVDEKFGAEAMVVAADLGLPLARIPAQSLPKQPVLSSSAASLAAYGTGSVAEAVALAAAGPGGRLLGPRVVSGDGRATCALALCGELGDTVSASGPQGGEPQ